MWPMCRRVPAVLRVAFAWLLAACATPPADCALHPLTRLHVAMVAGLPLVPVVLDGHQATMVVDTGAERSLLTEGAVTRLDLPRDVGHVSRTLGVGGPSTMWDARVDSLVMGGVRFPLGRLAVGRFAIGLLQDEAPIGLLGSDILLAFDLDIDLPHQAITLYRARRCAEAGPPWPDIEAVAIPGVVARKDRLLLPLSLDGQTALAVFDTGAQHTTIGADLAARVGVTEAVLAGDSVVMQHGAGPDAVTSRLHRFGSLAIGPFAVPAPRLAVVPNGFGLGDALVGLDFLQHRRVWISFAGRQVWIGLAPGETPRTKNSSGDPER
jgi:predicted aspartyl protease